MRPNVCWQITRSCYRETFPAVPIKADVVEQHEGKLHLVANRARSFVFYCTLSVQWTLWSEWTVFKLVKHKLVCGLWTNFGQFNNSESGLLYWACLPSFKFCPTPPWHRDCQVFYHWLIELFIHRTICEHFSHTCRFFQINCCVAPERKRLPMAHNDKPHTHTKALSHILQIFRIENRLNFIEQHEIWNIKVVKFAGRIIDNPMFIRKISDCVHLSHHTMFCKHLAVYFD